MEWPSASILEATSSIRQLRERDGDEAYEIFEAMLERLHEKIQDGSKVIDAFAERITNLEMELAEGWSPLTNPHQKTTRSRKLMRQRRGVALWGTKLLQDQYERMLQIRAFSARCESFR